MKNTVTISLDKYDGFMEKEKDFMKALDAKAIYRTWSAFGNDYYRYFGSNMDLKTYVHMLNKTSLQSVDGTDYKAEIKRLENKIIKISIAFSITFGVGLVGWLFNLFN